MMEKETSTRRSLLRALYLLPLVCISLALNAQTKVTYVYNDGKKSSGQLTYNNKPVSASITYDEIKLDGESLEGITLDGISRFLPDVKTDAQGNITSQGHEVKKIIINGKVLYKKSEPADDSPAIPTMSYMDNGQDINMEFTGYSEELVDKLIKSLPDVEIDEKGNMTVNGKKVSKILVNGQNYTTVRLDDQDNVNVNNVPNDAQVKDIIQKLPGAEIDADGNVTIDGKPIKKILVNGKELDDVTTDELTEIQSAQ